MVAGAVFAVMLFRESMNNILVMEYANDYINNI